MLTKKQFLSVLLVGVVVCIILCWTLYTISYRQLSQQPSEAEDVIEVITQEEEVVPIEIEEVRILPTTQVSVELLINGSVYETQQLDANIVMGMSEDDLRLHLSAYDVALFTEREVILQKHVEEAPPMPNYVLGVREGSVGVVETTGVQPFISLNLDLVEFSNTASGMILEENIPITIEQRHKLQLNPHYIEVILQNQYQE